MDEFARISDLIDNPDANAPARVRRLLIRATRSAPVAVSEHLAAEIDAFNGDFELLVVSAAIASSPPLPELKDMLRRRLDFIRGMCRPQALH